MKRFILRFDDEYFIFKIRPVGKLFIYRFGRKGQIVREVTLEQASNLYHDIKSYLDCSEPNPSVVPSNFFAWRERNREQRRVVAASRVKRAAEEREWEKKRKAEANRQRLFNDLGGGYSETSVVVEDREQRLGRIYYD